MDIKNAIILVICYIGILLIIVGIIIIPSQSELRDVELRTEKYFEWDYEEIDHEESDYGKALDEYGNLKWRQIMATQLGYLGLAFIISSITIAVYRFEKRERRSPPTPPPYPYPEQYPPPSRKPEEILYSSKRDFEERF